MRKTVAVQQQFFYCLFLKIITSITMMATGIRIPTHTPALKIPPMTSQLANEKLIASRHRIFTTRLFIVFMNTLLSCT